MSKNRLPVIEIFGPTIQGEGALIGQRTHFIRLGGCDFNCSWCDSMHAVDPAAVRQNKEMMLPSQIVDELQRLPLANWVSISGGNPALFDLFDLSNRLRNDGGFYIAVETQGSIYKDWFQTVDHVTLSPKGPSANTPAVNWDIIEKFLDLDTYGVEVTVKIVVASNEDVEFVREFIKRFESEIYVQVCNQQPYKHGEAILVQRQRLLEQYRLLVERLLGDDDFADVRITPQMHVLLWGNELGR